MTTHDQHSTEVAATVAHQRWQPLVHNLQTAWKASDTERAHELFEELVFLSTPLLLAIARSKLPAEMAEDIVAEAYIEFYELLDGQRQIENGRALLCRIVRLRSIDTYRRLRKARQVTPQVDETVWGNLRELPDVLGDTPEEAVVSDDTAQYASNVILDALTKEERQVLILRSVHDLSVAETAAQLHLTEDVVKKRMQRAIRHAYRVAEERGLLHDLS
ncbi:MAG: RNA polymerase sigma factor [Ktedonobacterales bacterium]